MTFDLDRPPPSDENPVYYVQYAHARLAACSRRTTRWMGPASRARRFTLSTGGGERDSICCALDDLPDVVADAAEALEPHRLTDALEELARRFHLWYHDHRILVDDEPLARARLGLARATQNALREGLALLGVAAPETM